MTRILLVEDETRFAAALARGLRAEGFSVDHAADGTDGLWLARQNRYDVAVLDIMLPGCDGFEICEQLRAGGNWTPILMLTARGAAPDIARALDSGADDYVVKPFPFVVLVARIRALLRRGSPERPASLVSGSLRLDPAARRAYRGDTELELTAREFAVLEFLMRRAGQAVSKLEILEDVWDFAFDGDPNIIEVYVRRLRRKIDEPFHLHTITTLRGAGYRLDPDGP